MKNGYHQHFKKIQKNSLPKPKQKSKSITSQDLRNHIQAKAQANAVKKQKSLPKGLILSSLIGVLVAAGGLNYLTDIERLVKKVEISLFGYASAEEKATPAAPVEEKKEAVAKPALEEKQTKHEFTEDEISHFAKLNDRKRELDAREEELNRLESELAAQKTELEKRLGELDKTRRDISSVLDEKVKTDDKKVDSLVSVYSVMKPQQAAKVFESMDEDLAIEILGRMKKKPAAEILNLVKFEKAQILSEKYAGYKRK